MPFDPNLSGDIHAAPLFRLAPDGAWQTGLAHTRREHLLIWITRGQGRICVNGVQRGFGPYTAIFLPAGTLWSAEFTRQCLGQVLSVSGPLPLPFPDTPVQKRFTSLQDQARLTALFEAISREQDAQDPLWHRSIQAHCELAAIALHRQPDPAGPAARQTAAQRLCHAYCRRIAGLPGAQAAIAGHAAALKVTPTHLTRVCKAETGKTAAALLTERQLHAARTLLISSDLPIRDIAAQLGFGSAAYFTRFISQHAGQTPSALRKAARNKSQ
ncbi:helix-turn-helix transcriptional regulator [Leisingera methylohalidivorans]|uniref:AraC family transcriptional regulator n=1 Tax=Leisingera methylohalidivorans DSM 14336 TaxID=999552 RepID=V9VVU6_9RHOB|nr:helix-turn-helix domain-containing protein [Leisingera methylohalidivorans]AHD01012.1 AraC family transcriptional regulator [Leisingera methylohalidivorans DSM 14336]